MSVAWEVTERNSGTYTSTTDWSLQYDDPALEQTFNTTVSGELHLPDLGSTLGRRARLSFNLKNPCEVSFRVANPGGTTFQVRLNGELIGELSTLTSGVLPCIAGWNVLDLVVQDGGIVFLTDFLGGSFSNLARFGRSNNTGRINNP